MTDHKDIREADALAKSEGWSVIVVESVALSDLLADLDEAHAALSEAKAGGWQPIEKKESDDASKN